MKRLTLTLSLLVAAAALTACADEDADLLAPTDESAKAVELEMQEVAATVAASSDYIVVGRNGRLPARLEEEVAAAGATLVHITPEIGVALVRAGEEDSPGRLARLGGVQAVVPDLQYSLEEPRSGGELDLSVGAMYANPPFSGDDDFFFDLQWGHDAVDAVEAWNLGHRGENVRIAILDSGIQSDHPDIAANLNVALSTSFVPGEDFDNPPGSHGTHVAGTVAGVDNGYGIIGIAPDAELVAVKVLSAVTGSGSSYWTMAGLVYAGNIGADIANMSLGIRVPIGRNAYWYTDDNGTPNDPTDDYRVHVTGADIQQFIQAYQSAVDYARDMGVTVIASAGNESLDLQHTKSAIKIPAELRGVISVSATGPNGWAIDPATDLDLLASYSNYGKSGIDFAAPGGNWDYPGAELCALVVTDRPCWIYDGVFSTTAGGWSWSFGTSMAAPHVSGVAALIVGKNGGSMTPQAVEKALRQSADDLGKPGQDAAYGAGRVNAYRAVQ